jgi:alkylresorcinol/alkylpyrone synthase
MFIAGLGIATPATRYSQRECWEALRASGQLMNRSVRARAILRKVLLSDNGITTRHLALDDLQHAFELKPDILHARFLTHAPELATQAARAALLDAGAEQESIDALVVSTCTGYLCPGLTSHLAERLNLRPDILALDLVGQGCGAALPNLRTCEALLATGRQARVLSVCVEVCSAAFYLDDEPGVLISACLFGDGAAAALVSGTPLQSRRRVEWKAAGSLIVPRHRDELRFEQRDGMLRNILTRRVPILAARNAETVLDRVLGENGVSRASITTWILHAGGRDVLQALQEHLGLPAGAIDWSAGVLSAFGNLSSPFVLFVLKAALSGNAPPGMWWIASFGAGFSSHGALLEVH